MKVDLVDLDKAAELTGFTKLDIGGLVKTGTLTIVKQEVEKKVVRGIDRETLRGIGKYNPPAPPPKPAPKPAVQPARPTPAQPWEPSASLLASIVCLSEQDRAVRIAGLSREYPELRAYLRTNPLPPVFRRKPTAPVRVVVETAPEPEPEPPPVVVRRPPARPAPQRAVPRPPIPAALPQPAPRPEPRHEPSAKHGIGVIALLVVAVAGFYAPQAVEYLKHVTSASSSLIPVAGCDRDRRDSSSDRCQSPVRTQAAANGGLKWVYDREGHLQLIRQP